MNLATKILLGIGAYKLLSFAGGKAFERIEWSFLPVRIFKDVKILQGGFVLRLRIKNTLPTDINISSYQGEIKQNGSLLATIQNIDPLALASGQEVVISTFAKVSGAGTLAAIAAGQVLAPVEVVSYVGLTVAGEEIQLPVTNTISLFYVE